MKGDGAMAALIYVCAVLVGVVAQYWLIRLAVTHGAVDAWLRIEAVKDDLDAEEEIPITPAEASDRYFEQP